MEETNRFSKYENPDQRCTYPFEPIPVGYCWSFAHHIDGTKGFEDMAAICPGCECWKERHLTPANAPVQERAECNWAQAWVGRCKKPVIADSKFCAEHQRKCCSCGEPATHDCDETGQFVCGSPLCNECEHLTFPDGTNGGAGFNAQKPPVGMKTHCKKTEQQYEPWFARPKADEARTSERAQERAAGWHIGGRNGLARRLPNGRWHYRLNSGVEGYCDYQEDIPTSEQQAARPAGVNLEHALRAFPEAWQYILALREAALNVELEKEAAEKARDSLLALLREAFAFVLYVCPDEKELVEKMPDLHDRIQAVLAAPPAAPCGPVHSRETGL